jgi:hypothetical protein
MYKEEWKKIKIDRRKKKIEKGVRKEKNNQRQK